MTTPTHRRPRRGRMAVAATVSVMLVVAGLVLLATAGSNRSGDPAQAIAGAPSSTITPNAPGLPSPPAGAAPAGDPVSTPDAPGHPSPGAVADGPVSPPGSDAGGPGAPPAASGVPAPGAAVPGQPGSSGGQAVPGGVVVPGPAGNPGTAAPGAAPGGPAGNPGTAAPSGTGVSASARSAARAATPPAMPPNTLALPSLGVGPSPLGPTCAEPNGILEPPVNPVGMLCDWRGSASLDTPGGEVSIAGHINYNTEVGAFSRLSQLRPGDLIYTRGATGAPQTWVVGREYSRSKTLPLDAGAFMGPDGPRQLVLISCGGALIPGQRSYSQNIYVDASPA